MAGIGHVKGAKKKKVVTELKAENIDNTAPVNKILEELQHKNVQAYAFYSHVLKQRRTTKTHLQNYHYVVPGHPLNTFDDDWNGQLNMHYFEPFPYKSLPPKMITELKNIEKIDPVTQDMKSKMEWQHTLQNLKLSATFSNMIEKYENLNDEVVRCPKHLIDIAAHLDSDPDPHFNSSYNWYYAGNGNLQLTTVDWVDYLLYSVFNCVYLKQFNIPDITLRPDVSATFECAKENNILETICSSQNIVILRTKNKVYMLKIITSDDQIKFEKLRIIQSELPYTSVSFDNHHKNILYVTTLDQKLSIINLDRMKARSVKLSNKLTSLVDNWNTVIGSGRDIYTHVTKRSVNVFDKRTNLKTHAWNELRHFTDEITCNDISVARHFEETTYLYIGTDHHLFLMDLRSRKNNFKVVQRWTHGMEVVPTYLSYVPFEYNKDLICLSSQWCEDTCVLPNYNDRVIKDPDCGGTTIPFRPPSILSVLNEAKQRMLCCDLYSPLDARLCTSVTGNMVLEYGEKYSVLVQNSLGDVTCHTIYPEHLDTFVEDDSAQSLNDWSQHYRLESKELEVTSVENVARVLKQLRKMNSDFKVEGSWGKRDSKFSEQEVEDAFENEEIDGGLREVWTKDGDRSPTEQSSFGINLYYSYEETENK